MDKQEKNKKEKKGFFKEFKAELKKVNWPTSKQLVNNTVAVITIVLLVAVIVFVLDFAFESLNTYGINKLRNLVQSNNATEQQENTQSNEQEENTDNIENTENADVAEDEQSQDIENQEEVVSEETANNEVEE